MKIPITKILLHLRRRVADGDETSPPTAPRPARLAARAGRWALGTGWLYRLGLRLAALVERPLAHDGWVRTLPPPLDRWTQVRPMPAFRGGFRSWWRGRERGPR